MCWWGHVVEAPLRTACKKSHGLDGDDNPHEGSQPWSPWVSLHMGPLQYSTSVCIISRVQHYLSSAHMQDKFRSEKGKQSGWMAPQTMLGVITTAIFDNRPWTFLACGPQCNVDDTLIRKNLLGNVLHTCWERIWAAIHKLMGLCVRRVIRLAATLDFKMAHGLTQWFYVFVIYFTVQYYFLWINQPNTNKLVVTVPSYPSSWQPTPWLFLNTFPDFHHAWLKYINTTLMYTELVLWAS